MIDAARFQRPVLVDAQAHAGPPHIRLARIEQVLIPLSLLWLLVGPRIAVPGTSGIRYEDLVFVLLAVLVLRTRQRALVVVQAGIPIAILTAACLLSSLSATVNGRVALLPTTLYSLRPLEYWTVFPAVLMLVRSAPKRWRTQLRWLLLAVTVLQTGFALAQYLFKVDVGFSHQAYSRGAGLTAGPYELGAISATLFIYWLAQRRWLSALIALAGLLVSISRISIIGVVVAVAVLAVHRVVRLVRAWRGRRGDDRRSARVGRSRTPLLVAVVGLAVVVLGAGVTVVATSPAGRAFNDRTIAPITERFTSTSIVGSWQAAKVLADGVAPVDSATRYNSVAYDHIFEYVDANDAADVGAEPSNLVRFFRWNLILDNVNSPERVAVGLGPSFVGGSVDGSYLRFFADGGVIGVAAWLILIVSWFRRVPVWMSAVVAAMLVGATFIDIVYALRPMVILWALLALSRSVPELERPSPWFGVPPVMTALRRRFIGKHTPSLDALDGR